MAVTDRTAQPTGPEPDDTAALEAGLDALETRIVVATPAWRRFIAKVVPPLIAIGLVIVAWQLVYTFGDLDSWQLPSPADVWSEMSFQIQDGTLQKAIWISISKGLTGFAMAIVVAVPIGVLVARLRWLRTAIGPILSALQTLPSVAWVPLMILWFGISDTTLYAVILLGAVPSIANGLVAGFDQTPRIYGRVGKVLGARGWTMVRYIELPAAMPGFIAGLKQGWAFAWRSLMAAEIIVASSALGLSLGQLLNIGRDTTSVELTITTISAILFVGLAVEFLLFAPLERRVLKARGLGDQR